MINMCYISSLITGMYAHNHIWPQRLSKLELIVQPVLISAYVELISNLFKTRVSETVQQLPNSGQ